MKGKKAFKNLELCKVIFGIVVYHIVFVFIMAARNEVAKTAIMFYCCGLFFLLFFNA